VDRTLRTLQVLVNGVVVATTGIRLTAGLNVDGPRHAWRLALR
jgi:hypothetical protein